MKGKVYKSNDKWVIDYTDVTYTGGDPKILGSYTKSFGINTISLHPEDVEVFNKLPQYIDEGSVVRFKKVKVDSTWYGKLIPESYDKEETPKLEDIVQVKKQNDWEEILFDFIDFYPCILPHELFEWLQDNYEIPKKKWKKIK
jgi:organic radical activating enzyme